VESNILIGLVCTIIGGFIGVATFSRNRDKDVKKVASESAEIKVKLDIIGAGVEQIRFDIKANEMQVTGLSEKVIRVEEAVKSLHKRVDKVENKEVV